MSQPLKWISAEDASHYFEELTPQTWAEHRNGQKVRDLQVESMLRCFPPIVNLKTEDDVRLRIVRENIVTGEDEKIYCTGNWSCKINSLVRRKNLFIFF